ncbi:hypothetical protein [Chryseobacterium sp. FH2]|uniref:hypothetical protein n=1 Tax=Chryseobacterium sp. FH2 TaxID=1674291 RepID=UPI00069E4C63|nr:hypothetical protein [Chryseobacterium sp. FH2]
MPKLPYLWKSLEHPVVAKANNMRINIGSKEEFLYRRLSIQASQKRIQAGVAYARLGNGAKRKQKALYKTENLESRYVSHRLHLYSRKLINFCTQQQAGTLILKNQDDKIGIADQNKIQSRKSWNRVDHWITEKIMRVLVHPQGKVVNTH